MKVKYPLDSTLRKQLADTLKYLRKSKLAFKRDKTEVLEDTIITSTFRDVSLQELLEGISPEDYSSVFIRGVEHGYEDSEGFVELYSFRLQTDEEYFEVICDMILPTAYQQKQYEDYLRLKSMFDR